MADPPESTIDRAVRLARDPLLREIAALKEELAALKKSPISDLRPCDTCTFRASSICRRCADSPLKRIENELRERLYRKCRKGGKG